MNTRDFLFKQNSCIHFGVGFTDKIGEILAKTSSSAIIACDPFLKSVSLKLKEECPQIKDIFSEIEPNPQLSGVMKLLILTALNKCDTIIAIGGGSVLDTAKFVKGVYNFKPMDIPELLKFFRQEIPFNATSPIKIIAVPSTAGTGAEVTSVSVVSHGDIKNTINSPVFLPDICVVDPALTLTVPPKATMITGLDALSHALESFWNINNQPITDLYATEAAKHIFSNLIKAYEKGNQIDSRVGMSYGALLAGLAFSQTRTAGCHAASYPLSMLFHLPHGEACAFTLAGFIRLNNDDRLESFAREVGFQNTTEMANYVVSLQRLAGLRVTIEDLGISDTYHLSKLCVEHPLMKFNPVQPSISQMQELFRSLGK
jgi:alcohol dehydrogenase